jgi:hypothetical protein
MEKVEHWDAYLSNGRKSKKRRIVLQAGRGKKPYPIAKIIRAKRARGVA